MVTGVSEPSKTSPLPPGPKAGQRHERRAGRPNVFLRETFRSIRNSLGRFLAIIGIVALGCGFFAGLQMTGRDMRLGADRYYDGTELYDLRVISTDGFTDEDVERISSIEGVEATMASTTADFVARLGDQQIAVRISTIDSDAAASSELVSDAVVASDDDSYLNRVILEEGTWPTSSDECVISADAPGASDFGIGDTVEVLYGTSDVDDVLSTKTFKVVGIVSSPVYPYSGSFGTTTLGDGSIEQYLYVTQDAFAEDYPYTEVYLTVEGADAYENATDEYQAAVDEVANRIDEEKDWLAEERLADIKADAQAEIDDARADYEAEKADVEQQLADAKAALDDAWQTLEDSRAQLDSGWSELESGVQELADGREALESGQAELDSQRASTEQQLSDAQDEIDAQRATLDAACDAAGVTRDGLDAKISEVEGQIETLKGQLEEAQAGLEQAQSALTEAETQRTQLQESLEQAQAAGADTTELEATIAQLDATITQLQETTIPTLEATVSQLTEGITTAEAGLESLEQLKEGYAQLDAAQQELDSSRSSAEQELASAQATLDEKQQELDDAAATLASSREELEQGEQDYADGLAEYNDGVAEYESQRADAESQLADAEAQIEDAQQEVDDLEAPDIYTLDRTKNEGCEYYRSDADRISRIADVFPTIFFLVAALVALTTMTRMVDDDRILIGTFKALGYSKAAIASKYLVYAAIASVTGAVVGILVLTQVLPYIIVWAYSVIYTVPILELPLPVDAGVALMSASAGVGVTLVATLIAVASSLRATPATLMLPLSPKPGKRILLERITPLWRRISFSWKVTFRNIFRYKRRLLMTLIGIAGCSALLLVGFGLHDSIWDIIDRQFGPILHYDTTVSLDSSATEEDVDEAASQLSSSSDVERIWRIQLENMMAGTDGSEDQYRASVIIPEDSSDFADAVTFRERESGASIEFNDDSVIVTEKLADMLGIGVGDQILVYDEDDVGNAVGDGYALTVTGVMENYTGNAVYVGKNAWSTVGKDDPDFSTLLAMTTLDEEGMDELSNSLHELEHVSVVSFMSETIDTYRTSLSVVDYVVVVLVVSAAALAFIVLYNLTNINVSERVREIASLKVLGFNRREVYAYIFREMIIIAIMGDAIGMLLGTWLETFVITTAEVDYVMFGRLIHPLSYAYAFFLTIVFSLLAIAFLRKKLDRVNMVESLKSVD